MTRMLASVANVQEAECLLPVHVDILDIKDPRQGALGAVAVETAAEIVNAVSGQVTTSATIGDLPMHAGLIDKALTDMKTSGVDIIKVGVFAAGIPAPVLEVMHKHTQTGVKIVLVFFADLEPALNDFAILAGAGIYGVMLDTADKSGGSLCSVMDNATLTDFIHLARATGLVTGLAGSLRREDIVPLLMLKPDYLGFRGALCIRGQRKMQIDIETARKVRALIPVHRYPSPFKGVGRDGGKMSPGVVSHIVPPSLPFP